MRHDNTTGHHGDDASTAVTKWATAGLAVLLFIALVLALAWGVSQYMNKASVATIAPPTPPVRMVDVSGPDPSIVYAPPTPPTAAPTYQPKAHKVARDPWADDLVTKPTFAESK